MKALFEGHGCRCHWRHQLYWQGYFEIIPRGLRLGHLRRPEYRWCQCRAAGFDPSGQQAIGVRVVTASKVTEVRPEGVVTVT